MQNITPGLLLLTVVICGSTANAASVAAITALQSPVWLQQGDTKTELGHRRVLQIGDSIATGDTGRAQMQLWVDAILQLNSNSEIAIRAGDGADITIPDHSPELYLNHGRACIFYTARSNSEGDFKVNLGNAMFAAIHIHGDICVLRQQGLSAIKLHAGSVELTHAVDSDTIILSEAGTEFHIDDTGSYEILFPGGDDSATLEIETPFIVAQAIGKATAGDSLDTVESNGTATDESTETTPETISQDTVSAYIYTVYLFSTRAAETAQQANQKFQKAGYETQIYESRNDSGSRYRIAVTGFESRQSAQAFSDSIVGKLGVKETWIGRDKPSAVKAVVEEDNSDEPIENVDSNNSTVEVTTATEPESTGQDTVSAYVYTVYLFSTQSEENAERVNQKFQQAGHDTQIFASTTDSGARYRVAATGFESRQLAQAFSDSIEGKLGVSGTWIGKEAR